MIPDITSAKVAIPGSLFLALTPGFILSTDGTRLTFNKNNTNAMYVLFHALVFFLMYAIIARQMNVVLTKADLLVTTTLFILLSPGMLLTLPPGSKGVFRSGQTNLQAQIVHTLVFAFVFAILRKQFPQYY